MVLLVMPCPRTQYSPTDVPALRVLNSNQGPAVAALHRLRERVLPHVSESIR